LLYYSSATCTGSSIAAWFASAATIANVAEKQFQSPDGSVFSLFASHKDSCTMSRWQTDLCVMTAAAAVIFVPVLSSAAQSAPTAATSSTTASTLLPEWAYPVNPPLENFDAKVYEQVPGSTRKFTRAQIENDFTPPDWHPGDHPAMPTVVAVGRKPIVMACMKCHLPNGAGHPESSDLVGLSAAYIQQQMIDFRNGNRHGARALSMFPIAKEVSDSEVLEAAQYFSALPPIPADWRKIVETDTVQKSFLGTGAMRFAIPNGGTEPIGKRIIEFPQQPRLAELRDSRAGFIAYAPKGSIAKGEALVTTGGGKTLPCSTCHGPDLKGLGDIPRIIGRSPMYVFRQLNDVKIGSRKGPNVVLMQTVVANLTQDDMLAIAAYLTSKKL
jgi:cytochrome c553